jgi:Dyp-type peroxidase family
MKNNNNNDSCALDNIQATILKSHGRKHVCNLFITFKSRNRDKQTCLKWIADYAERLTSAEDQIKSSKNRGYSDKSQDGGLIKTMHLNKLCFENLGIEKKRSLNKLPDDQVLLPSDRAFNNDTGSINDFSELFNFIKTPDPHYDSGFHVLIVLADDSKDQIIKEIMRINASFFQTDVGQIEFFEMGRKIMKGGKPVEHFGYQDGISERLLLDKNNEPDWEFCNKHVFDENFGTYLVFLKLEQNVKLFNEKLEDLGKKLKISSEEVGYQVFGRSKEGIPITMMDENGNIANLRIRPELKKCPYHAHIRKAEYEDNNIKTYIFRRGITYGERRDDLSDEPGTGCGLLFISYQKSISNQFEVLQKRFNDVNFPENKTGLDPIMGQYDSLNPTIIPQEWMAKGKEDSNSNSNSNKIDFNKQAGTGEAVVNVMGAAYFYTPTISLLKELALVKPPV